MGYSKRHLRSRCEGTGAVSRQGAAEPADTAPGGVRGKAPSLTPRHRSTEPGASDVLAAWLSAGQGDKAARSGQDPHCQDGGVPTRPSPAPAPQLLLLGGPRATPLQALGLPSCQMDLGSCPLGILVQTGRSGELGWIHLGTDISCRHPLAEGELEVYASEERLRSLPRPQTPPESSWERVAAYPCSCSPDPGRLPAESRLAGGRQAQSVGLSRARGRDSPLTSPVSPPGPHVPFSAQPYPDQSRGRPSPLGKAAPLHQLHQPLCSCPAPTAGARPSARAFTGRMINPLC